MIVVAAAANTRNAFGLGDDMMSIGVALNVRIPLLRGNESGGRVTSMNVHLLSNVSSWVARRPDAMSCSCIVGLTATLDHPCKGNLDVTVLVRIGGTQLL